MAFYLQIFCNILYIGPSSSSFLCSVIGSLPGAIGAISKTCRVRHTVLKMVSGARMPLLVGLERLQRRVMYNE